MNLEALDARDVEEFPPGRNITDTVFGGIHFNLTTLEHWNYTYYSNGTVSNNSRCYLTYEPYQPALLLTNGTFVNATTCYNAVDPVRTRGYTGIGFAVAFGLALVLTITVLAKHGRRYLPVEKRFYPLGRRWQWYWGIFVCACALISLFVTVDVARYHVPELPIVVMVFFWFLICMGTVALVWEAVRHWGSWQERQYIDPNPFILREGDRRSKTEFWLPLWFYFWLWMNFFLVVPRSWKFVEYQRSPDQTAQYAIPTATGARFKAAGFCLVIAWLTICFSLRHSISHYKPRNRGVLNRTVGFVAFVPLRFVLLLPLSAALIAYQVFMSFVWEFSLIRYGGNVAVMFGWGFGPSLLILFIQIAYGYASPNEDKELLRQRHERGQIIDRELGLVKRPAWWRRVKGEHLERSMRDRIFHNVKEVGGVRGIGRREEEPMERHIREDALRAAGRGDNIELDDIPQRESVNPRVDRAGVGLIGSQAPVSRYTGKSQRRHGERVVQSAAGIIFPNNLEAERARRALELSEEGPPPPYPNLSEERSEVRPNSAHRTNSTSTTNTISSPPQQVRSMLDV